MGRKASDKSREIIEGVYIRQVNDAPIWQCYFRLDEETFRKSTKKKDEGEAGMVCLKWYNDARFKRTQNQSIKHYSFKNLAAYFLKRPNADNSKYKAETISRHFLPFFEKFDDLNKIDNTVIAQYNHHRNEKSEKSLSPKTLHRELSVLNAMFKYAEELKWITHIPKIPIPSLRGYNVRGSHFDESTYSKLHNIARNRIEKASKESDKRTRAMLYDYIILMANTGMRVDESRTLKWKHVASDFGSITLEYAGKT
ncbi:MAG: hypothetical protein MRY32_07250, partial [Rickettsiales bacterium]|nr:hypothetical protein [Rickettsiales bacterium]